MLTQAENKSKASNLAHSVSRESILPTHRHCLSRDLQHEIQSRAQATNRSHSQNGCRRHEYLSTRNQLEQKLTPLLVSRTVMPDFSNQSRQHEETALNKNERSMHQKTLNEILQNRHYNSQAESSLHDAIISRNWSKAISYARSNPEMCRYQTPRGYYPLHCACVMGSCPFEVVLALVEAYPEAVNLRNSYPIGDTPLHTQARNCQKTSSKMKILLENANLRLRDRFGNTVLHVACGTNSIIDVLRELITKDSLTVDMKNNNGETSLETLWNSFLQSIPGHLSVARILSKKTHETTESLKRFWDKVKLLVLRERVEDDECLLGQYMLRRKVPLKMLHLAIMLDSRLTSHPNKEGNYFLHLMILQGIPFESSIFKMATDRIALEARNVDGETALSLCLRENMVAYLDPITRQAPELLVLRDKKTSLYPFQLAAAVDCSLDVIFRLLVVRPEVASYRDK